MHQRGKDLCHCLNAMPKLCSNKWISLISFNSHLPEWCCRSYRPACFQKTGLTEVPKVFGCSIAGAATRRDSHRGARSTQQILSHAQIQCTFAPMWARIHTIMIHAHRHNPLASLVHAHAQPHTRVLEVVEVSFFMRKGLFLVYHISPL